MSTLASSLRVDATKGSASGLPSLYSIAVWLGATLITLFFALLLRDSAVIEGALPAAHQRFLVSRETHSRRRRRRSRVLSVRRAPARPGRHLDSVAVGVRLPARKAHASRIVARTDARPGLRSSPTRRSRGSLVNAALFMAVTGTIGLPRRTPSARDGVLCAVAADPAAARGRHDRPPLRRAHVRPRNDLARPALVLSVSTAHRERPPWERHWASPARFTTGCSSCSSCRSLPCSCSGCAMRRHRPRPVPRFRHRATRDDAAHSVALRPYGA